ncbi:hypothetical protein [Glycomyces tenuis]|uniref:hypothetical protein n=1 Tax=Glycomyces tenuis TaxID=58116 RepID=UPI0012DE4090|nr:hypothetical protein [Glycomyces tenuis]
MEWMTLPEPDPLVIKGPEHTGKSALVGVAACRRRDRFPHGMLHSETVPDHAEAVHDRAFVHVYQRNDHGQACQAPVGSTASHSSRPKMSESHGSD